MWEGKGVTSRVDKNTFVWIFFFQTNNLVAYIICRKVVGGPNKRINVFSQGMFRSIISKIFIFDLKKKR